MVDWNKLSLKGFDCDLAENLYTVVANNRSFLSRWVHITDKVNSVQDARTLIQQRITSKVPCYFITYGDDGIIGVVRLRVFVVEGRTHGQFVYWVTEQHSRKGIVTWAVQTMMREVVENKTVDVLVIRSEPENVGSQRIAEKCGFELVETVKNAVVVAGASRDLVIYNYVVRK